jgi:tRNA-2-methylthio-N6-dimethylallyladenosine synthase
MQLNRRLYIQTLGCQMNVNDSDRILRSLETIGCRPTPFVEDADLVLVNTCAIRAKAEQKAFSFIGRLAKMKRRRPELVIGVGGCVAQQEGERILARMPLVDFVFGTHAIARLPRIVATVIQEGRRVVDVDLQTAMEEEDLSRGFGTGNDISRFVTIMRGCDNYCTYCVVPHVRGRETSRPPERIVAEIEALVASGVREVTLLGQNVNSYGRKEGLCSFAELLERVHRIQGLWRIRFTTSHPKDLSDELVQAFGRLERLCPHIHLPVQSGSDEVLRRMHRQYTVARYRERVEALRRARPEMAITSDVIVGFPGERSWDFEATRVLVREVEFDGLFAFMYSDREVAPASRFSGKLPEVEKRARLAELLALQEGITILRNQRLIGSRQEVLVEGASSRPGLARGGQAAAEWTGRTPTNKIVNFAPTPQATAGCQLDTGHMVTVRIESAFAHSLWGVPETCDGCPGNERSSRHAA